MLLEEAGADANASNSNGWTPLLAVYANAVKYKTATDWAHLLLSNKANPDACVNGNKQISPFVLALYNCRPFNEESIKLVEILLKHGVDPNTEIHGTGISPLMLAASSNNVPLAKLLLSHGADPDWQKNTGAETALLCAIGNNNMGIAQLLLENGANPNLQYHKDKKTLLRMAVEGGDVPAIKMLMGFHAEVSPGIEIPKATTTDGQLKLDFGPANPRPREPTTISSQPRHEDTRSSSPRVEASNLRHSDDDDDLLTQFREAVSDPSLDVATASYFLELSDRDVQAAAVKYKEASQDM
ncbi:ankyrin repeat, family A (RFXANK-like), 2 [Seminavis robusta]|uniref:Ankyrin repeat, family A (RFXANK-like), 2 n=1 Tax=Seminavis robusta TaxID=568900 RepID=A0A9N8EYH7_9STRA|nr:ankyrin repeat, family A (RFXANK-like), 2 [Seminavis robusta]CAB9528675.1 ankyrin repeat, family A (RFXANK-like), 2 [Seminavis robusta]|eukprot:Sro1188_g250590.1 ankyrin repeat, family A (RFXANK-like), 2 (298) ;mRNA; r:13967-14860